MTRNENSTNQTAELSEESFFVVQVVQLWHNDTYHVRPFLLLLFVVCLFLVGFFLNWIEKLSRRVCFLNIWGHKNYDKTTYCVLDANEETDTKETKKFLKKNFMGGVHDGYLRCRFTRYLNEVFKSRLESFWG